MSQEPLWSGLALVGALGVSACVTAGSGGSAEALGDGGGSGGGACTMAPRRHTSDLPRRTPRHS